MAEVEVKRAGEIAYREAAPAGEPGGDPVLCIHGFPESSYMWQRLLPALAEAGYRALAPDLPGFGDSSPDPPGTWERHVDALERFRQALGIEQAVLIVHDWGGLVGLRWACDHPGGASALVISDTGFFADGRWHGMAKALRTEGTGEELIGQFTREGLGALLSSLSPGFDEASADEYWKAFASDEGRQGLLDLYRSGDFEKLEPYAGKLAALGLPAICLWGENDEFARWPAPTASAGRCPTPRSSSSRERGISSTPTTPSAARARS